MYSSYLKEIKDEESENYEENEFEEREFKASPQ